MTTVPLRHAVLCAGCATISDATGEACPACASRSLLSLAVVLDGQRVHDDRADYPDWQALLSYHGEPWPSA